MEIIETFAEATNPLYLFAINQLKNNKHIRGIYNKDAAQFSFWYAVYAYDYLKTFKVFPTKINGYKDYIFDFYNVEDDEDKRTKKIKNNRGKFIDHYDGFDFKNEILKFCDIYNVSFNLYAYNPFNYPQYYKFGEVGNAKDKINLLILPFEPTQFFLITNIDYVNGRLINNEIADELHAKNKLLAKELRARPIKEFYNIDFYNELLRRLTQNFTL